MYCEYCQSPEKYGVLPAEMVPSHGTVGVVVRGNVGRSEPQVNQPTRIKAHRAIHTLRDQGDWYLECNER
jgi:hypothetical protein